MRRQAVIGTLNTNRLHRHTGKTTENKSDTGHCFVDLAIFAARTFGEYDDAFTLSHKAKNLQNATRIRALLVNRNNVAVRQRKVHDRVVQKCFSSQVEYLSLKKLANHGRVKEALVISHINAGTVLNEFFAVDYLYIKKGLGHCFGQCND